MSQYGSVTTYQDDNIVAVRNNRVNVDIEMGRARSTGTSTYVRSTYSARYNFAVRQFNVYVDVILEKRQMFGGLILLYNIVVLVLFGVSIGGYINADDTKAFIAVPFVISIAYLLITFYNWHIFRTNGSLVHRQFFRVNDYEIPDSINKHLTIPLRANVQNQQVIAATDGSTVAIAARLRQEYINLTEIDIMLYDSNYEKHMRFPVESIVHFLLFAGVLGLAILKISGIYSISTSSMN